MCLQYLYESVCSVQLKLGPGIRNVDLVLKYLYEYHFLSMFDTFIDTLDYDFIPAVVD